MTKSAPFVLIAIALLPLALPGQSNQHNSATTSPGGCEGPTQTVHVYFSGDETSGSYEYEIRNGDKRTIMMFVLGRGLADVISIREENVPVKMQGPAGWSASHRFSEQTNNVLPVWSTSLRDDGRPLPPNARLAGFSMQLPKDRRSAAVMRYPDGSLALIADLKTLPFVVYFTDGKCVWGKVEPHKVQSDK